MARNRCCGSAGPKGAFCSLKLGHLASASARSVPRCTHLIEPIELETALTRWSLLWQARRRRLVAKPAAALWKLVDRSAPSRRLQSEYPEGPRYRAQHRRRTHRLGACGRKTGLRSWRLLRP